MPNSSNNYKTGEICDQEASYQCLDCHWAEREIFVDVSLGLLFPFCKSCPAPGDATWHLVQLASA